jgi:hypothetical protein
MHSQLYHGKILRSAHKVYLRVLYGYQNKQRLFTNTESTD